MHGFRDVDLNDDLAGCPHARDHGLVLGQSDGEVDVIAGHLAQSCLHYQWQWLQVRAVDDLVELERIGDLRQKLLVLHALDCVTLHRADVAHALLCHQLVALLVVVFDDVVDDGFSDAHLLEILEVQQVCQLDVAVFAHHYSLLFCPMAE